MPSRAYRMEGGDADWVDDGSDWAAMCATLPPGCYAFRVRGPGDPREGADDGRDSLSSPPRPQVSALYGSLAADRATARMPAPRIHARRQLAPEPVAAGLPDPLGAVGGALPGAASFLRQVQDAVESEMGDEAFSVERLAAVLGLSRGHLHRKLTALLGQTPSGVIRDVRLERSASLLASHAGTVGEVAYAVGFKSVSHFSNSFKARFGCRPSAYVLEAPTA